MKLGKAQRNKNKEKRTKEQKNKEQRINKNKEQRTKEQTTYNSSKSNDRKEQSTFFSFLLCYFSFLFFAKKEMEPRQTIELPREGKSNKLTFLF